MKTTLYYFSATGNSLYAAKKLASLLPDCELINIVTCIETENLTCDSDNIGMVCPIHAFGLPIMVTEFLSKLQVNSKPYTFAMLTTGGGKANLGFAMLNRLLKTKGLSLDHSLELKYINNYHLAGGVYSPQDAKPLIISRDKDIISFTKAITTHRATIETFKLNPFMYLLHLAWKNLYTNKSKKFKVDNKCIECDICSKVCPTHNISTDLGTPTWGSNCVDCCACINNCPMHAIDVNKKSTSSPLYRNPFIELKDLFYR